MNFILSIIAAIVLFFSSFFNSLFEVFKEPEIYSPCVPLIHYKLGSVDPKFRITEKKLLKNIDDATLVWEKASGRDIFLHDEDGVAENGERIIIINMVYDERQRLNSQVNQLEGQINTGNKSLDASITDYEARVKSFNERSAALSEKIKGLDIHDPEYKQKFDEVYKESEDLNREADELNKLAATLNQSTESYNQQVANLNSTISRLNATLAQKPEEGIYNPDGDVIEIYITSSEKELIHTLAHEFGHSLGIDHIENKEAIMYPYSTQLLKTTEEDVNAVTAACKERVRE